MRYTYILKQKMKKFLSILLILILSTKDKTANTDLCFVFYCIVAFSVFQSQTKGVKMQSCTETRFSIDKF